MFYKFKVGHDMREITKNIYYVISEGVNDHSTVMKWFKKSRFSYKNLDYQAKSGRPKIKLQVIEVNPASSTQRVLRQAWHLTIQYGLSLSQSRHPCPVSWDCRTH